MNRLVLLVFISVVFLRSAFAWNAEGHKVVAQIAYNHLDPVVRSRCDALIALPLEYSSPGTSNFVTASVWADAFKGPLGTGTWHYIDLLFSLDGTSTNGIELAESNIIAAIRLCVTILQDTNAASTDHAIALRYLLHFVGDIQQPLHCSMAVFAARPNGDYGGNGFGLHGTWSNLHFLWDDGGGFLTDTNADAESISNKAALVESHSPYVPDIGSIPDPMDWALEGLGLAQTVAYVGVTRNTRPSTNYLNTVQATTEQRLAIGGRRLASLLNGLFATDPITVTTGPRTNGRFNLTWTAVAGRTYRVQWKDRLIDPMWNDLTNVTATSEASTFTEPPDRPQRFYRIAQ